MKRELSKDEMILWRETVDGLCNQNHNFVDFKEESVGYKRKYPHMSKTLDLHGFTVMDAHKEVESFIQKSIENEFNRITIITGKSGQIVEEFPKWVELCSVVKRYHMKPNKGSWEVWLEKKNST